MKNNCLFLITFIATIYFSCSNDKKVKELSQKLEEKQRRKIESKKIDTFKNGDIIFQISLSGQGKAIQLATKSNYTHCGLIVEKNNQFYVFEAETHVKAIRLKKWIERGKNQHFVVKRLKNAEKILTKTMIENITKQILKYNEKQYDIYFSWSDEAMYCSELVWKIYQKATGIEVGNLQKLKDFDLTSNEVKQKLKERYGNNIPLEEKVISPESIFKSDKLEEIMIKY
ncbi:MAG: YiiX family permuted papain-like enzyme [Cytophagia bacterium]|nr:MAG: YiiX family permuted papain-like enzyme [Cytophagia bacterium]TAG46553.1 MAG: YiiX family permuted papain-like enzyme [Cytophagia bacterium]